MEKASAILKRYSLCDACLGRQFARSSRAESNANLGKRIRDSLGEDCASRVTTSECELCSAIREKLEALEERITGEIEGLEIRSFLVGVSIPDAVVHEEDLLRMRYSLRDSESIRRELGREAGRRLREKLGVEIDYEKPDVTFIFNLVGEPPILDLQINPVFVFGRYRKLERGISQTDRYCPACQGKGCELCFYTGYENEDSIESMISRIMVKAFEGNNWKFHGAGREDLDARMLGNGRPFVVEVLRPRKRTVDLKKTEKEINAEHGRKIEVLCLRESSRREMQHIKTKKFDKTYEFVMRYSGDVGEDAIRSLPDQLAGVEVRQQTPARVMPRRKDTTRRRLVKGLEVLEVELANGTATIRIRSESGLYIKELVTGDDGRTQPNVKDIMGLDAVEVESLDVVRIHDDFQ